LWQSTARISKRIALPAAEKEDFAQALGTSRGGRTSKLHGAADEKGRPRLILLTPGNASDMATARALIARLQAPVVVHHGN
jgi:hypothetical protein